MKCCLVKNHDLGLIEDLTYADEHRSVRNRILLEYLYLYICSITQVISLSVTLTLILGYFVNLSQNIYSRHLSEYKITEEGWSMQRR